MKKLYLAVLATLAIGLHSFAQKVNGSVKGVIQDSTSQPLSDATVSIMRVQDSSLISFTVTVRNGSFEIKNLEAGNYSMIASYTGLKTLKKSFSISAQAPAVDFGAVQMGRNYKVMDEVV